MSELSGRTFLITGGNTGIGLETARKLAARGGRVYIACRSAAKGQAAVAAIVTVSSDAQYMAKGIDWTELRRRGHGIGAMHQYSVSKLCNVLFTQELARREPGISCYALHPGMVASDIWRRVPWPVRPVLTARMLSVEDGAKTSLYCATAPEIANESGLFYDKCAQRAPSPVATPELAADLWQHSTAWTSDEAGGA
jgi:retinol dehydrogenase-12